MSKIDLITKARQKCLQGIVLEKKEIIELLQIEEGSDDYDFLCKTAFDVAKLKTGSKGYLWGAIGIDYASCPMSCDFCSFGEKWNIVKDVKVYTKEQIVEDVKVYVANKVHYIVLRTTEFYELTELEKLAKYVREKVPGDYELVLNIGEFDTHSANRLHKAGVNGIYHSIRLREGVHTRFNIEQRRATLSSVQDSELDLHHLVEPVGEEHTNEEIADRFLESVKYGVNVSGVMARIPVEGTPLGNTKQISDQKIAKLTAITRLSGGDVVKGICVHPISEEVAKAGANVVVVEKGAIPRDTVLSEGEWNQFSCVDATRLLFKNGFEIN